MTTQISGPPPTIGAAPFDSSTNADVVLRSIDNVVFFTCKSDLVRASSFFSNLLVDGTPQETYSGFPLCPVPEDSGTIHFVLRLCSPGHITVDDLLVAASNYPFLPALDKYLMDGPRQHISDMVCESAKYHMKDNPIRIFVLARVLGLPHIAREAAYHSLRIPMHEWSLSPNEASQISGLDYHALVQYHQRCGAAAFGAANVQLKPGTWDGSVYAQKRPCALCTSRSPSSTVLTLGTASMHIRPVSSTTDYSALQDFDKILHLGDSYLQAPGKEGVSDDILEILCDVPVQLCASQLPPKDVRKAVRSMVLGMQRDVASVIEKVPLEIDQ